MTEKDSEKEQLMGKQERVVSTGIAGSNYQMYAFSSSVLHLLPEKLCCCFSGKERLFLLLRAFRGYQIYYLMDGEKPVSYSFFKRNYLHKYAFLQRGEVLINPYFVFPEYRGNGLGGKLLKAAMEDGKKEWSSVWAVVLDDNEPSIRTLQRLGFSDCGFSDVKLWSHRLTKNKTGRRVFRKLL